MTESPLPPRAEALLSELSRDPEGYDWDRQALAIAEKLEGVALGSTSDVLLEAPLFSAEAGDGELPVPEPATPQAAQTPAGLSLSDLARSVAQKPRSAKDSLVTQSLAMAAAARAQPPAVPRAPALVAPNPGVAQVPPAPGESPRAREPRTSLRSFLAGAGVAIAAGVAATLMLPSPKEAPTAPPIAQIAQEKPVAARPTSPQQREVAAALEEPSLPSAAEPAPAPPPAELAAAPAPVPATPSQEIAAAPKPAAPPPASLQTKRARVAKGSPEPVVLEDEIAAASKSEGVSPPKPAEESSQLRPASGASSPTIADRPSSGAVQAAIGGVLGVARACVAGLTGTSTASLVFASDGSVSRVTLSGPASGTPAGKCVESALRRARVAPFSQPSYVVSGVSIRP